MKLVRRGLVREKLFVAEGRRRRELPSGRRTKQRTTHRPDNFLTMLRRDRTTPYTSFASSSNGRAVDDACWVLVAVEAWLEEAWVCKFASFVATTTPVLDERVFRALLYPGSAAGASAAAAGAGVTARDTAYRMPFSVATFGRLVRCQSW